MNVENSHFLLLISLVCLIAATATNSFSQSRNVMDLDATVLQANAKLIPYNRVGPTLDQLLIEGHTFTDAQHLPWTGLDFVISDGMDAANPLDDAALLMNYQKQTCTADAVIVGHSTSSQSHLSANGTTVYTDYAVVIDALLKDNSKSSLKSQMQLVVTRPGGSLSLPNGPVTMNFEAYPQLQTNMSYVQFLEYIPDSFSYQTIDSFSTLYSKDNSWFILKKNIRK